MNKKRSAMLLIALSLSLGVTSVALAQSRVVVTIKPVHGLVAAVLDGIEQPKLILTGNQSIHGYQLKPSDAQSLEQAEAVFWIGPTLETSVSQAISNLPSSDVALTLSEVEGLTLYENRESVHEHHDHEADDEHDHEEHEGHDHQSPASSEHEHEGDDHGHAEHGHDEHGHDEEHHDETAEHDHDHHDHGVYDPHIWLDVSNAKVMAQAIARFLIATYPQHEAKLQANTNRLLQNLDSLDQEITVQAAAIGGKPYIVFHDAYQYLEKSLGLNNVAAVTMNPERTPGVRKINELKEIVHETGAVCAFAEPQFSPRLLEVVAEDTQIRMGVIDPLGAKVQPGPNAYFEIIRSIVNSLTNCLT